MVAAKQWGRAQQRAFDRFRKEHSEERRTRQPTQPKSGDLSPRVLACSVARRLVEAAARDATREDTGRPGPERQPSRPNPQPNLQSTHTNPAGSVPRCGSCASYSG